MIDLGKLPVWCKLDARVASLVMGWHARKRDGRWIQHGRSAEDICSECGQGEFSPSTNIESAWLVVEHMLRHPIRESLTFKIVHAYRDIRSERLGYGAEFASPCRAGDVYRAWAPTAPLAICLAALKCVGAREKNASYEAPLV